MDSSPTVRLDTGLLRGARNDAGDVDRFLGVPYAAPPVGPMRWRPPAPPEPWSGTRDALEFGPICPQPKAIIWPLKNPQSEDCLTLNVWRPTEVPSSGAPVMLWIHGGGFCTGSAATIFFDGEALARLGAMVVTINYRLGPLGFLAHPALSAESPDGISGNDGFADMIAALQWVRANAAAFGGDPARVTVFGESAGAAALCRLMVSPAAEGLFHRGIAQSGHARGRNRRLRESRPGLETAESVGEVLASAAGCGDAGAGDPDSSNAGAILACLRSRSPAELLTAKPPIQGLYGAGIRYAPIVDGHLIPDDPDRLFGSGRFHRVPLLVTTNENEGSIFVEQARIKTVAAFDAMLDRRFGTLAAEARRLYPVESDEAVPAALERLITDASFLSPARELARQVARAGARAGPAGGAPVWRAHFTRVSPAGRKSGRGAFHAGEVAYVFGRVGNRLAYDDRDRELSREMMEAWVRFAMTGSCDWPAFAAENETYRNFGDVTLDRTGLRDAESELVDRAMTPDAAIP